MIKSLKDVRDEIRRLMRDTASTPKWSDTEVTDAIRGAARHLGKSYFISEVYTSAQLTPNIYDYYLPRYVQRVRRVEREDSGNNLLVVTNTNSLNWQDIYNWDQMPTQTTNLLHIPQTWPTGNLRVYYERDAPVPPADTTLISAVSPTATAFPVVHSQVLNREWPLPGYFKVDNELIAYEAVSATSFTSLTRGAMDTMAASHGANSIISAAIGNEYDKVEEYIFQKTIANLYVQGMADGGRRDAQAAYTLHQDWDQRAEATRRGLKQPHGRRTIKAPSELS